MRRAYIVEAETSVSDIEGEEPQHLDYGALALHVIHYLSEIHLGKV